MLDLEFGGPMPGPDYQPPIGAHRGPSRADYSGGRSPRSSSDATRAAGTGLERKLYLPLQRPNLDQSAQLQDAYDKWAQEIDAPNLPQTFFNGLTKTTEEWLSGDVMAQRLVLNLGLRQTLLAYASDHPNNISSQTLASFTRSTMCQAGLKERKIQLQQVVYEASQMSHNGDFLWLQGSSTANHSHEFVFERRDDRLFITTLGDDKITNQWCVVGKIEGIDAIKIKSICQDLQDCLLNTDSGKDFYCIDSLNLENKWSQEPQAGTTATSPYIQTLKAPEARVSRSQWRGRICWADSRIALLTHVLGHDNADNFLNYHIRKTVQKLPSANKRQLMAICRRRANDILGQNNKNEIFELIDNIDALGFPLAFWAFSLPSDPQIRAKAQDYIQQNELVNAITTGNLITVKEKLSGLNATQVERFLFHNEDNSLGVPPIAWAVATGQVNILEHMLEIRYSSGNYLSQNRILALYHLIKGIDDLEVKSKIVKVLEKYSDPNKRSLFGAILLLNATHDPAEFADRLRQLKASNNWSEEIFFAPIDNHGRNLVHNAMTLPTFDIIGQILTVVRGNARLLDSDEQGNNVLHLMTDSRLFDIIRPYLSHTDLINLAKQKNQKGLTPIALAYRYGLINFLRWCLGNIGSEILVDSFSPSHNVPPPMVLATLEEQFGERSQNSRQQENEKTLRWLIANVAICRILNKADPEIYGPDNLDRRTLYSALMYAIVNRNKYATWLLLLAGANPNRDVDGKTPTILARETENNNAIAALEAYGQNDLTDDQTFMLNRMLQSMTQYGLRPNDLKPDSFPSLDFPKDLPLFSTADDLIAAIAADPKNKLIPQIILSFFEETEFQPNIFFRQINPEKPEAGTLLDLLINHFNVFAAIVLPHVQRCPEIYAKDDIGQNILHRLIKQGIDKLNPIKYGLRPESIIRLLSQKDNDNKQPIQFSADTQKGRLTLRAIYSILESLLAYPGMLRNADISIDDTIFVAISDRTLDKYLNLRNQLTPEESALLPDIKDPETGDTPLHRAIDKELQYEIQILLALGAKLDAKNNVGKSPLDLAKDHSNKITNDALRRQLQLPVADQTNSNNNQPPSCIQQLLTKGIPPTKFSKPLMIQWGLMSPT